VPGRDVAGFATEALASLRAQTFAAWRDPRRRRVGDATSAQFAEAAASDPRFTVVRHGRRAVSAPRATRADLVSTPLVGFLDADDVDAACHRAPVGAIDGERQRHRRGRVRAPAARRPGRYAPGPVQPWVAPRRRPRVGDDPRRASRGVGQHRGLVEAHARRDLAACRAALSRGALYEDQVVAQRLYVHARAIDVIPDVVVQWRERADGSSITQRKDVLRVLADYLDAMRGGIAVLDAAGQRAAARARIRLILEMDTPRSYGSPSTTRMPPTAEPSESS
jgi:hypothetical protein